VTTTLTIRDDSATTMPQTGVWPATGDFRPTNYGTTDTFVAPAPAGPYSHPAPGGSATFASVFGSSGAAMNGPWKLWIVDDAGGDVGTIQGWKITFTAIDFVCAQPQLNAVRADFDGDGRTDLSVWRPTEGNWYLQQTTDGFQTVSWGLNNDRIQPGDFDADGEADFGVYRPSNNTWYGILSSNNTFVQATWGVAGDIPVLGHYVNAGLEDTPAVWRPSNGRWYIFGDTYREIAFGQMGDVPVPGDYNGDGTTDYAVWRPTTGEWHVSVNSVYTITTLGLTGDMPVPADYDGDGKDDLAVWQPSTGRWSILRSGSGNSLLEVFWGLNNDVPVPGDYDGDGSYDVAVWRPSEGRWYIIRSTAGIVTANWGLSNDKPAPVGYIPN